MARLVSTQCGLRLGVETGPAGIERLVREAGGDAWTPWRREPVDVHVCVPATTVPFDLRGWAPLTRGAWTRDGAVVVLDAGGSGVDVQVRVDGHRVAVEGRLRPSPRGRVLAAALPWRSVLLTRAVLLQYPVMWAAGLVGRVPLHAAAVEVGDDVCLLAGPGGVGRSTLLLEQVERGARACTDNLAVGDGADLFGLVEPVRVEGATGRRMPHGRRERELPGRVPHLRPTRIVVLRRGTTETHTVRGIDATSAARVLTAGTYVAGELRRYWAFAATLALGTGAGPAHPAVEDGARRFADRLPAVEVTLGTRRSPSLDRILAAATVDAA